MAYDSKQLKSKAKSLIKKHNLIYINEVCCFLNISKPTFYEHFPVGSDDYLEIINTIDRSKIQDKARLRGKMMRSGNVKAWERLYRLLSTPEEHRLLSNQSESDPPPDKIEIVFVDDFE